MAKHEVVTPHTLEAAHKRIAALEKDLEKAKHLGGAITETMEWESEKLDGVPCQCSEAASLRAELAEVKRQLLDAHKAKDRAEEFIKDFGETLDAYRAK